MSELINNQELRIKTLKEVILHLHSGEAPEAVRGQLKSLVADVDASEIAATQLRALKGERRLLQYDETPEPR
jgi:DUF438 domain-containing protein